MLASMRFERVHFFILSTAAALFLILILTKYELAPSVDGLSSPSRPKHHPGRALNIEERMARSEESWQRHVKDRIRVRGEISSNADWKFWGTESGSGFKDVKWHTIWDFFVPAYTCPWDNQRVGKFGDGGKWICGMSKYMEEKERTLVVYSFGVKDDSSFEEEMLSRTNAKIVAVDFSVDSFAEDLSPAHYNRTSFMKVGLAGTDEPKKEPPFYTLTTLMKKHNHEYIDILKVDVEGAEFESMTRFMDDHAEGDLPVGLISMELHLDDPAVWTFGKVTNFMERLESFGMRITAYELNLGAAALYGTIKYNEYVWVNTRDNRSVLWHE